MNASCPAAGRRHQAGLTLIELTISLAAGVILALGLMSTLVAGNGVLARSLAIQRLSGEAGTAFFGVTHAVHSGTQTDTRKFVVYVSATNLTPVANGTAGQCLYVPYTDSSKDVRIYVSNGRLVVLTIATGKQITLTDSGVTGVTFTADRAGSPLSRTGAVLFSLTATERGQNMPLSGSLFPRDS